MSNNPADAMPFSKLMGVEVSEATPEGITATLMVREDLCTTGGILHGGAIMAFADALGGIGAFLTLPEGSAMTTTIESTTKFLGGASVGETVTGICKPVKIGRRTSVWQTEIKRADGKWVALVTQTQMAL